MLDPSFSKFLNFVLGRMWIVKQFGSANYSTRYKWWIRRQLEDFGIKISAQGRYVRPTDCYGHTLWTLANELQKSFSKRTLRGLKEYGCENLKLDVICCLSNNPKHLKEIRRSQQYRFYRARRRLVHRHLAKNDPDFPYIISTNKGAKLAQILLKSQRELNEGNFIVSVKTQAETGGWSNVRNPSEIGLRRVQQVSPNRTLDYELKKTNFATSNLLVNHLRKLWEDRSECHYNEYFQWLFIGFPSRLKEFIEFNLKWPETGLGIRLPMHRLSKNAVFRTSRGRLQLWSSINFTPQILLETLEHRRISFPDSQQTVVGFAIDCNLSEWIGHSDSGVLGKLFSIFQNDTYCNSIGKDLNEIYRLTKKHDHSVDLPMIFVDLQPLELRYLVRR